MKKEIDRLFEENIDRKRDMCQDIGKIDTRDTKSCCRKPDIEGDNISQVINSRVKFIRRKPDIEGDNKVICLCIWMAS